MIEENPLPLENEPSAPTNGDGHGHVQRDGQEQGEIALADAPVSTSVGVSTHAPGGIAISERAMLVEEVSPRPPAPLGLRTMPPVGPLESETQWKRWLFVALAIAFLCWPRSMTWHNGPVGYFPSLMGYWAPAHPGINQNGYLVGGKFLAQKGTMGFKPTEPYVFLGWMWNLVERTGTDGKQEIWYYPKYPIGVSALFAGCIKAAQWMHYGEQTGKIWAFYVNPVCMTLAMFATFLLVRLVAGSFCGFCGMVILSFSQVTLQFADQPLSHGPALCAVTWGVYFLARWWQTASIWRGILAGLFLGYAVTTRYTEGLLVIPMAAAALCMIRYRPSETRWASLGVWIAILLGAALWFYGYGTSPSHVVAIASLLVAGVVVGLLPMLRGDFRSTMLITEGTARLDAPSRVGPSRILEYVKPRELRERWPSLTFHWLRIAVAIGIVWAAMFIAPPAKPGTEDIANAITLGIFKAGLIGALVLLYLIPWQRPRGYLAAVVPTIAWLIPVGILVGYNWFAMHSISGYDTTNESTAFTWKMFTEKWDDTVQQVYDYSVFLIPPLATVGMFMMYRRNWRAGLIVTLWFIPGFLLYTSYYFGQQRPGMWYLRFFLTLFPPMVMAAMWLLKSAADGAMLGETNTFANGESSARRAPRGSVASPIAIGLLTFASAAIGLNVSLSSMEREAAGNINLAYTCDRIIKQIPIVTVNGKEVEPLVFADGKDFSTGHMYPLNNMLQFAGDFELYASDGFSSHQIGWRGDADSSAPNPLQAKRQDYQAKIFRGKSDADMIAEQNRIMRSALADGRPVFAVLPSATSNVAAFKRFITEDFRWKQIDQWKEPARVPFARTAGSLDPNARGMPLYNTRSAQTWQMYEITRKTKRPAAPAIEAPVAAASALPAVTAPTTQPITQIDAKTQAAAPAITQPSAAVVPAPVLPAPVVPAPVVSAPVVSAPVATTPAAPMPVVRATQPTIAAPVLTAAPVTQPTIVAPAPAAAPTTQPMIVVPPPPAPAAVAAAPSTAPSAGPATQPTASTKAAPTTNMSPPK